jgi:hypothetical protein
MYSLARPLRSAEEMAVSEPDVDVLDSNLAGGVAIRGGALRTLGYVISMQRDPAPDDP